MCLHFQESCCRVQNYFEQVTEGGSGSPGLILPENQKGILSLVYLFPRGTTEMKGLLSHFLDRALKIVTRLFLGL